MEGAVRGGQMFGHLAGRGGSGSGNGGSYGYGYGSGDDSDHVFGMSRADSGASEMAFELELTGVGWFPIEEASCRRRRRRRISSSSSGGDSDGSDMAGWLAGWLVSWLCIAPFFFLSFFPSGLVVVVVRDMP